jgi:chemotaxis protein methyltransferase CheR
MALQSNGTTGRGGAGSLRGGDPVAGGGEFSGMSAPVFDKFRTLIYESCGITLADNKEALVSARIGKRMRTLALTDYNQYYQRVVADRSGAELTELVNSISTNVTHFFREARHFDLLGQWLREWQRPGPRNIRIWSAASSTGEEPYSIAMTVLDHHSRPSEVQLLASDISTKVIQIARFGVYKEQDIQNIPLPILKKHFQVGGDGGRELYRVKAQLREMVLFQQINLSTPPYPIQGHLDVIFCRNVMIYFNRDLRKIMIQNFHQMLKPGGFLIVGMAESLSGLQHEFQTVEPSVYRKR